MTNIHERGQNEGNPCPYTIKGKITVPAIMGPPIPLYGAQVIVKGNPGYGQRGKDKTNTGGRFRVSFPGELSTEKITVWITADGYLPVTVYIHPKPWKCVYNIGEITLVPERPPEPAEIIWYAMAQVGQIP